MDKIIVKGGNRLKGEIEVSGAKNAALPILAATILSDGKCIICNAPRLMDISTMVKLLRALGMRVSQGEHEIVTRPVLDPVVEAPYKLVSTMRASVCVLGPLLARFGEARVSMPGGCVFGPRPIDLHLKGLEALGAKITVEHGYICARAPRGLRGGDVYLGGEFGSSVLATANVMMAATLARGETNIENAACEPEVVDLANFLIRMGAKIHGAGSHLIQVKGVKKLRGTEYSVIPDRIEAGTYMVAAAITRGDLLIKGIIPGHNNALIDKLRHAGVHIKMRGMNIRARGTPRLHPVNVTTLPYPGFPTDLQAQMMALMTVTPGISVITEKIYPNRFVHTSELNRMGSKILIEGSSAIVEGVKKLSGAPVMASDLRASAALILAGLVAEGETEVRRVYHLDRGYEKIEEKLSGVGADIRRVKE